MLKTERYNSIFPYIFTISLTFFIVLASFYLICFIDKNMLIKLFDRFNTPNNLPFSLEREDLINIQNDLMNYLSGKLTFLETKVHINGSLTDFYSIRTKIHMGDVRNLFIILIRACYISIVVCIFSLFKVSKTSENPMLSLKLSYKKVLIVFFIIFIIIVGFALINFDLFFTKFHELLFDNDFWLLDPRDDFIICLLPEEIFMTIGIRIGIAIIIFLLLFYLCFHILSKIPPHQEAK